VHLARIVINYCAADAQQVEGRVEGGVPIPTLDAVTVTCVEAPANPYA
jgi:uncharacterized membrane protein YcgQ (UPF0703/DUF1980 family)